MVFRSGQNYHVRKIHVQHHVLQPYKYDRTAQTDVRSVYYNEVERPNIDVESAIIKSKHSCEVART